MRHLCGPMCRFIFYFILHHDGTGKRLNRNIHQYTSSKIGNKKSFGMKLYEMWSDRGRNEMAGVLIFVLLPCRT